MKNLLAAFSLLLFGHIASAQTSQEDIQAEMQRMKEQMQEQMAQFKQLMQETFDEDFLNSMPFRDTMIIKEFNFGDQLGEIDTRDLQNMMRDLQAQLQMQMEGLNLEEFFKDGFEAPAIPGPDSLEDQPNQEQNQEVRPSRKRRSTHSL
ncbi:MAG: hypothetical protein KDC24_08355 [Saprospiraceae bacterium]|nr:hypothetical protein [Saprospiraceae bacterium]